MNTKWILSWCCLATLVGASPTRGADDARPTVVVVVGAEGGPEYGRQFATWADRWGTAAAKGGAQLVQVGREGDGAADKERLKSLLAAELSETSRPLWLVMIGHGTFDGREAKFNVRGPDVSDAELADWLRPCKRPLAVIDCTSASAPFLNKLSGPGRVIVVATRSGAEDNFARLGDHLSAAIADPAADLDRDGQTSLLEAYIAASTRVEEFYKSDNRLATEHALLDDNGDALGTPASWFAGIRATKSAKAGAPLDGGGAHRWHLVMSEAERAIPVVARERRDALERQVEALRAKKTSMGEAEYYAALEPLLIELAGVYEVAPNRTE